MQKHMEHGLVSDVAAFVQNVGLPVALCIFFVWWSWRREKAMADRIDALEESQRELLRGTIAENTKACLETGYCMKEVTEHLARNTSVLIKLEDVIREANRSSRNLRTVDGGR